MHYPNLVSAFYGSPWAILPTKLEQMRAFLALKAQGGKVKRKEIQAIVAARRSGGVQMAGRVAVVPVFGVLSQRVGGMEQASGGISTEEIGATLDTLAADRGVKCIVMAFDSPGGSVYGVEELGRKILALRAEKKLIGVADSMAASAAYWLASQCSELMVTPGGQVGSIGVLAMHQDQSKMEEAMGVKTTLVTAGKYKAEGDPSQPLDEDARAEIQSKVEGYYSMFLGAVARGRGLTEAKVRSDFGQGRMMTAKQAVEVGAADKIGTLEQTLVRYGATSDMMRASARARAVEVAGVEG